ncbi:response regulator transcription factor [Streptomyces sp. DSM 40907]|uniref:response regulator transcription factor n=1 Tax=Streptomyces kutzneri TaxID=3051179 RepID=UPI0028D52CA3|nr:response regulator transcription factor [Streptomyces sp. DSM 40907]
MIRVVVDNEPLVRAGLRHALDAASDMSVSAAVPVSGAAGTIREQQPRVVLLDSCTADAPHLSAGIGSLARPPRACVLSRSTDEQHIALALASGAAGYALKDTPPGQLAPLIRFLAEGWTMTSTAITASRTRRYLADLHRDTTAAACLDNLTPREREVLTHLHQGLSHTDIACQLHLAHGTVKDHVSSVLGKLHATSRVQAALIADRATAPHHET